MPIRSASSPFEQAMLPHLDAAHNLARWLTGNDQDAQDAVQEAYLRALKFFGSFRGGDGRAWLLAIVRNTCRDWAREHRAHEMSAFDEDIHGPGVEGDTPETLAIRQADRDRVRSAIQALPAVWREVLILRELEGLSYREIGNVIGIPLGTVMSRLARARTRLHQELIAGRTGK